MKMEQYNPGILSKSRAVTTPMFGKAKDLVLKHYLIFGCLNYTFDLKFINLVLKIFLV